MRLKGSIVLLCLFLPITLFAEPGTENAKFEWQLDIGNYAMYSRSLLKGMDSELNGPLNLHIFIYVNYKRFFIEPGPIQKRITPVAADVMGFRLHETEQQQWAFILNHYHLGFTPAHSRDPMQIEIPSLTGLNARKTDLAVGLRFQHQQGPHLLSVSLLKDQKVHYDYFAELYYGYRLELANWDLYLSSELTLYRADLINYYYGVTEAEARPGRPFYQSSHGGQRLHFGAIAAYPLSKRWIVELGSGMNWYSSAFTQSPLTRKAPELIGYTSVRYVF
ncbi:MipA/OmpV family protein [Alkalimonas amylolytica]|uniref:Outer membrane scaffolding protein for murein synthesis, MipA/OmpV family n=1 Tax=Alkalimonas amylolytica TaxID=152573 RepID=A0A1H3ZIW5_ALKAM|nr:MipA/OmpV family protein [Alkalimonas amylolytica]SEA23673.1 Outer membrane scaffolding protein for murein synthesis, MipA/OmpV family [Alkalimonas amylolytica]